MVGVDDLPLEELHAEWLAHGFSTEPADFDAAERLIAELYQRVGLTMPSRFVRVASPPAGLRQLAEYEAVELLRPLKARIEEGGCDPLWYQSADTAGGAALLGIDISAGRPHMDIGKVCGWWWGLDDLVVMADRPCEVGAAIGFRDDWAAILPQ